MNRRGFMARVLGAIVAPAFVKAESLWLPPERPLVEVPERLVITAIDADVITLERLDGLFKNVFAMRLEDLFAEPFLVFPKAASATWHGLKGSSVIFERPVINKAARRVEGSARLLKRSISGCL